MDPAPDLGVPGSFGVRVGRAVQARQEFRGDFGARVRLQAQRVSQDIRCSTERLTTACPDVAAGTSSSRPSRSPRAHAGGFASRDDRPDERPVGWHIPPYTTPPPTAAPITEPVRTETGGVPFERVTVMTGIEWWRFGESG